MSEAAEFSEESLLNVLQASHKEPAKITDAAKWIIRFPEHAETIIRVWRNYLWNAPLDMQLGALYIANDIGQRWKRNKCSAPCQSLITAFTGVVAESMGHVYNNASMSEQKKLKLKHLSDVWCKQGLFMEANAAVRQAMGIPDFKAAEPGSPPASSTSPNLRRLTTSEPGTPSHPAGNEADQIETALTSLKPAPESDTWVDLSGISPSTIQFYQLQAKLNDLEREMNLAGERTGNTKTRLVVDQNRASALNSVEEVTMRGWELDRDEKLAEEYHQSTLAALELSKRLCNIAHRILRDTEENKKRLEDAAKSVSTDLTRTGDSRAVLSHRRNILSGLISSNTPYPSTSSTSSNPAKSPQPATSSSTTLNKSSDSRGSRDDRPSSRSTETSTSSGVKTSQGGRDNRDNRDDRAHGSGDVRRDDRRDHRNDHRRDGHRRDDHWRDDYPRDDTRRDDYRRDDYMRPRSPPRYRDSPHHQDRHNGNGYNHSRNEGSGRNQHHQDDNNHNNRGRRGDARSSQKPSEHNKPSTSAESQKHSSSNTSKDTTSSPSTQNTTKKMEVDAPTSSTSPPPDSTTPRTKRRNRTDAGMQATSAEAAGTKKPKVEEAEPTEFVDEF